jgi:Domain of unknown function (DUF4432)
VIERLANLDAVCSATASRTEGGWRALDLRVWEGIDVRLLPDRGFDCFGAWYRGVPLAWVSAVGERGPIGGTLRDDDWLVATCGLRNVGAPSDGVGMHGEISHQPAREVRVERRVEGDQAIVSASAVVAEVSALGHHLELERTWTVRTGEGRLDLVDVTRNLGRDTEPAPLLYHVNLGGPLWSPGATLALDTRATTPRDADAVEPWDRALDLVPGARERVFEHEVLAGGDGWCVRPRSIRRRAGCASRCGGRPPSCRASINGCTRPRASASSASSRGTARSWAAPPTERPDACRCSRPARSASRASRWACGRGS